MGSSLRFIACALFLLMQTVFASQAAAQTVPCMGPDTSASGCQAVVSTSTTAPVPSISEGVRLDHNVGNVLFNYYSCVFVAANSSGNDYFVPQATQTEFLSFLGNPPIGVTFANCVLPMGDYLGTTGYTATPSVPDAAYSIYAEGGAIMPSGAGTVAPISNIDVPTIRTVNSGIMMVPTTTTVSVVNQSTMQPIQFFYTRQDCVNDPYLVPPACNTWIIRETQTILFTAPATSPLGTNSSWLTAGTPPVVTSTYDISTNISGPWSPVTVNGVPLAAGGVPGIYNNDYQPPVIQSCSVGGVTYQDGETWVSTVTSTQSPTAAECPLGAGTRVDTMQSTVQNICNNGTAAIQSTSSPVEVSFTGACAATAPVTAGENIYVVDAGNTRVQEFDMLGNYVAQFGSAGSSPGQLGSYPYSIRVDMSGNLTIVDNGDNTVQTFTTAGALVGGFAISSPDMAVQAPSGNYWISENNNDVVAELSSTAAPMVAAGGFNYPLAVAYDAGGNTWVAATDVIQKLDSNGNVVFSFGSPGTGNGQFNFVWAFAFQPGTGNIYVADRDNNRIQVFTPTGGYLFQFGTYGTANGQFEKPIDLAFDPQGNLWVVELDGNRVQEFDSSGNYIRQFGSLGSANGQFNGSISIAITSGTASAPTCGASNGQASVTAPTTNLCTNGTATLVTSNGSGAWVWSCAESGYSNASCAAPQGAAGSPVCLGKTELGTYIGNPDNSSPVNQAAFASNYNSFASAMGRAPNIAIAYMDDNWLISNWASTVQGWQVPSWKAAGSPSAGITPMVAMPMALNGDVGDTDFQAIISGAWDSAITGSLQAWVSAGYTSFYLDPGWEMSGNWYPWGVTSSNAADFVAAFQHIVTLARAIPGATIKIVWTPNVGVSSVPTASFYPGDAYVDVVGLDIYSFNAGSDTIPSTISTGPNDFELSTAMAFAQAHGKPFALPETGSGSTDSAFPNNLAAAISASGVGVAFIDMWDNPAGGSGTNMEWDQNAQASAAWINVYNAVTKACGAAPPSSTSSAPD